MAVVGDNSQASTAYDFRFHDPGKWSDPMDLLRDMGGQLAPAYNTMSKYGLYSPDETNKISLNNDQYMLMKRRLLARAMKGRLARTLGARAGGAGETMFANQVLAPELANTAERRSNLLATSIGQGRQMGVSGMQDLMRLYAGYMTQNQENDTGWLDWVKALAPVAGKVGTAIAGGGA